VGTGGSFGYVAHGVYGLLFALFFSGLCLSHASTVSTASTPVAMVLCRPYLCGVGHSHQGASGTSVAGSDCFGVFSLDGGVVSFAGTPARSGFPLDSAADGALVRFGHPSQWRSLYQFFFWLPQFRAFYPSGKSPQRPLVFLLFSGWGGVCPLGCVSHSCVLAASLLAMAAVAIVSSSKSFRPICSLLVWGNV